MTLPATLAGELTDSSGLASGLRIGAIPMVVTGTYNPYLVALSILVASFASYTALERRCRPYLPRRLRSWDQVTGRCTPTGKPSSPAQTRERQAPQPGETLSSRHSCAT